MGTPEHTTPQPTTLEIELAARRLALTSGATEEEVIRWFVAEVNHPLANFFFSHAKMLVSFFDDIETMGYRITRLTDE